MLDQSNSNISTTPMDSLTQSDKYLTVHLYNLSKKSRQILSERLNSQKCIRSENGCFRDFRGIVELCGLQKYYCDTVDRSADHMEELLRVWCSNADNLYPKANVENLLRFLEEIDRYDVFDDVLEAIDEDMKNAQAVEKYDPPKEPCLSKENNDVLTIQDLERLHENKPLKMYDAFILFEDEDSVFVDHLYKELEQRNFQLCTKSDLLLQSFEHTAIVNLIEKRCRRVIAVITKNFLNSSSNSNRFLVDFAQAEQVESGSLRIIPIVIEQEVEKSLPSNLKFLHKMRFYKDSKLYNFWKILECNLMDKSSSNTRSIQQNSSIENSKEEKDEKPLLSLQNDTSVVDLMEKLPLPPQNNLTNSVSLSNSKEAVNLKPKKWYNILKKSSKKKASKKTSENLIS